MKEDYNYMFFNVLVSFKFIKNEMCVYKFFCDYCSSKQMICVTKGV